MVYVYDIVVSKKKSEILMLENEKLHKEKKKNESRFVKKGLNLHVFAKSVDPCQPAQSAQADMGRNFLLSLNFLHDKGPFYIMM